MLALDAIHSVGFVHMPARLFVFAVFVHAAHTHLGQHSHTRTYSVQLQQKTQSTGVRLEAAKTCLHRDTLHVASDTAKIG